MPLAYAVEFEIIVYSAFEVIVFIVFMKVGCSVQLPEVMIEIGRRGQTVDPRSEAHCYGLLVGWFGFTRSS